MKMGTYNESNEFDDLSDSQIQEGLSDKDDN